MFYTRTTAKGTDMNRIGPAMKAATRYVAEHPGCPKLPAAESCGPNSSRKFGYEAVNRAMRAGLIEDRNRGGIYALHITDKGLAAIS
jgi:hypothetical protein